MAGEGQTNMIYRKSLGEDFIETGEGLEERKRETEKERGLGAETCLPLQKNSWERGGRGRDCLLKGTFVPAYRLQS